MLIPADYIVLVRTVGSSERFELFYEGAKKTVFNILFLVR